MGNFYKVTITDGSATPNVIERDKIIYLGGGESNRTYIDGNPSGPTIPDVITDFHIRYGGGEMDVWPQYSIFLARDLNGAYWPTMSANAGVRYYYDLNVANSATNTRVIWFGEVGAVTTKNLSIYYVAGNIFTFRCDFRTGTTVNGTMTYNHLVGSNYTFYTFPWYNAARNRFETWEFEYSDYSNKFFIPGGKYEPKQETNVPSSDVLNWIAHMPEPADFDPNDPYIDIPDSTPSGPAEGVGLPTSDAVDIPSLPTFSVTDTGFVTLFNPTMAQVKALADYMWNGLFDINNFKKIFADPMDCILGFNMVPVAVPSGSAMNINIGNILTSVSMNVATSQWVELDCGSIDIGLPYGSYLDFSPYTKFSIYLPYIGTCELSADDVAGKMLTLKYHVDALSCACVAYLKCGNHVLYQWTGSCGYSIPVTQNDFSRMIMGMISVAAAGIGGAVVGGASAAIVNAGASAAKNVSGLKPEVHRSGAIGSSAGLMGGQTPYLIIEIPNACKPSRQYHYTGYPGFITVKVGDLSGYAEFEEIILDGIGCTEEERSMIESLCKGGIYI